MNRKLNDAYSALKWLRLPSSGAKTPPRESSMRYLQVLNC